MADTETAAVPAPVPPSSEPPTTRSVRSSQVNLNSGRQGSTSLLAASPPISGIEPTRITSNDAINAAAPAADGSNQDGPYYSNVYNKDTFNSMAGNVPEQEALARAKAYLKQSDGKKGSIFEHLTQTVMKILERRPNNPVDVFENVSAEVKRTKFRVENPDAPNALRTAPDESKIVALAKEKYEIFKPKESDLDENPEAAEFPDIMDLAQLWEWSGVAVGSAADTQTLALSIRQFVNTKPLKSVRVWGKIFGTIQNYIIIEAELKEGDPDEDGDQANQMFRTQPTTEIDPNADSHEEADKLMEEPDDGEFIPKPKQKVLPSIPKEERVGVNKYVYYVCYYPGGPWTRLPDVIPENLQASRKIRKLFTGDLTRKIVSYPPFDGTEAQYLRCQIARISSSTVASPAGYYTADPEDGGEEDSEHPIVTIINPDFPGSPNPSLLDPNQWVHHVPYILPQGRTTWANPNPPKEETGEEDENREEQELQVEPESGQPILRVLGEDDPFGNYPAWSAQPASRLAPARTRPVYLRSTRWPGAIVVAHSFRFCSIYVGDGLKSMPQGAELFAGPSLLAIQTEWVPKEGEEPIEEKKDPTVEEEKAFEETMAEKEEEAEEAEEEAEEES